MDIARVLRRITGIPEGFTRKVEDARKEEALKSSAITSSAAARLDNGFCHRSFEPTRGDSLPDAVHLLPKLPLKSFLEEWNDVLWGPFHRATIARPFPYIDLHQPATCIHYLITCDASVDTVLHVVWVWCILGVGR